MDASEVPALRLSAKEVVTPSGENFVLTIADGAVKLSTCEE